MIKKLNSNFFKMILEIKNWNNLIFLIISRKNNRIYKQMFCTIGKSFKKLQLMQLKREKIQKVKSKNNKIIDSKNFFFEIS